MNFKVTVLTGVLHRESFPIEGLDKPYVYWLLRLKKPICVTPNPADQSGEAENNAAHAVNDIQLVLEAEQYHKYRRLLGRRVRVSGEPFHMSTGHHMTEVLLSHVTIMPASAGTKR